MPMQSSLNWHDAIFGDRLKRRVAERLSWLVGALAAFLFALAALFFWRRATGAIHAPLSMSGIVLAGCFLSLVAAIAHAAARLFPAKEKSALLSEIALSLGLLAVAATLTMPGTSVVGLCMFWSLLLVEEGWAWRTRLARIRKGSYNPARFREDSIREGEAPAEPKATGKFSPEPAVRQETRLPEIMEHGLASLETLPPEEVTQQLTRSTAADDTEELAGWLRIPFAAGQRTGSVHLAFCPPFAHTPELMVEQIDGPPARIKTAQVLPYGARLDLKLHSLEETPAAVVLQFSARLEAEEKKVFHY
jgi:hypothetical protein